MKIREVMDVDFFFILSFLDDSHLEELLLSVLIKKDKIKTDI